MQHVARIMFQPQQEHLIRFWLEVGCDNASSHSASPTDAASSSPPGDEASPADGEGVPHDLHVELTVSHLDRTPDLLAAKAMLPEWVSEIWLATAYFSTWDF